MKSFNVSILGEEYTVEVGTKEELRLDSATQGECMFYEKRIKIATNGDIPNPSYIKEVVFHELGHAYLHESGLLTEAQEESYAEWLSKNVPRMFNSATVIFDKGEIV